MTTLNTVAASSAFELQLKTLCLLEFPCGAGSWRKINTCNDKLNQSKKQKSVQKVENVESCFSVTLKDYGADTEKTETLQEYVGSKFSPWHLDYSWSDEAKQLRELALQSPWLIDDRFVSNYFKTLRIIDKQVTELDENLLEFNNLEDLTLSANFIKTVNSRNLPPSIQILELCANQIQDLSSLCIKPPPCLNHLGLGYNKISYIGDYITGDNWPCLLSLDLSNNNLSDLLDVVRKLGTLPKLRNLVLQGNPLAFIPGYRGYIVDSLRKLSILDDLLISADERHHYKGLARRREYILDEAKINLSVSYIKGLPVPEEIKNREEQPEFPVIERRYYIEFKFLEDTSGRNEICLFAPEDDITDISTQLESSRHDVQSILQSEIVGGSDHLEEEEEEEEAGIVEKNVYFNSKPDLKNLETARDLYSGVEDTLPPDNQQHTVENELRPPFKLSSIITDKLPWAEELELNWSQNVVRDDLIALRDFFQQGMDFFIIEEMVLCYPLEEETDTVATPVSGKKGKDDKSSGKGDKKAKGGKPEKDDGKKKKKKEPEVELKRMPPQLSTLATFHVQLEEFLEGEFSFKSIYTQGPTELASTVKSMEISDKKDGKSKDGKHKKKPASAKAKGKDKDVRKASANKSGKDTGDKKGKGKSTAPTVDEEEEALPQPPLEVEISVNLHHWKTAMDSLKDEEEKKAQ
ncbi:hypothetical protein SNE40_002720 [Patella caerulea]|uniref:Leucine-rich repeat-containing protein 43 n=1 Tax=Patella caerulea TaxID=87958 RepID=A0AAN8KCS6_PATCE